MTPRLVGGIAVAMLAVGVLTGAAGTIVVREVHHTRGLSHRDHGRPHERRRNGLDDVRSDDGLRLDDGSGVVLRSRDDDRPSCLIDARRPP